MLWNLKRVAVFLIAVLACTTISFSTSERSSSGSLGRVPRK
jgi:hypothetical protein